MEYRRFGRSGVKVSAIGMGTYYDFTSIVAARLFGYWRGRRDKIAAIRKGIELGINLIDTAQVYQTEPLIAEAIKEYRRDELFIATKVLFLHLRYNQVLRAAERSLRNLQTSYIDLYQIHQPSPLVPIKETMSAMEKLVEEGKVRYIGVSNFSLAQFKAAEGALSRCELISNQVEYNLKVRRIETDLLPYCEENNIAVMAYRPIAHGALAEPSGDLREVIDEISERYGGKNPAQIAINWLLSKRKVIFPIPRASRPARVIENAGALGWSLEAVDMAKLENSVEKG